MNESRRPPRIPSDPPAEELVPAFSNTPLDRDLLTTTIREVSEVLRPFGLVRDEEWDDLATIQSRLAGPGLNARFLALRVYPTFSRLIQTLDREEKPAHLLSRESFYQTVRRLQLGNRILPLVADFASPTALPRLGDWLRKYQLIISVIYLSDVEFFLLRSDRFPTYLENLARLPWAEGALLVRTSTREIVHRERVPGDSSTTIVRPVASFMADGRAGLIRRADDLFRP